MTASTSVHSNAFNFLSFVQHGVDPRTGQYTVSLSLPELEANDLAGPAFPLALSFNPLNTTDEGFGLGWGLNLSEYRSDTRIVSLSSGETFKVTGSGSEPAIAERKLDSFRFYEIGSGMWRLVHRSGLKETLLEGGGGVARSREICAPSGHAIQLAYTPFGGGERLLSVSDATSELLRVEHDASGQWVELLLWPGRGENGAALARFLLKLDALHRVEEVVLPTVEEASWRFVYTQIGGLSCLQEVFTPTGGHETVFYEDGGHHFPASAAREPLPRVTRHIVDPGFDQPAMETRYRYSAHNFLGQGTPISWDDDGLDNLYKVADYTYRYGSTVELWVGSAMKRKVERSFNRFHLMSEEVTTQDNCVKRVTTTYYADLPDNLTLPFDRQPPQCQLPFRVETRWELSDDSTRQRTETVETIYDEHGNLLEQKNADGTREVRDYYPVAGEGEDCPPDPDGFVRSVRSSTVLPDPAAERAGAPTLRTRHRYAALPSVPGQSAAPWLVDICTTLFDVAVKDGGVEEESELTRTETAYFDDGVDPFLLGRPRRTAEILNGLTTATDYTYTRLQSAMLAGETVLEARETVTGFDGTSKTVIRQHSLLNGEPLLVEDLNQVQIRYSYDALMRVTAETVAPGTEYEATRRYAYTLVANKPGMAPIGQAEQVMVDVKGVKTRTRFDGANRAIHEERQDTDTAQAKDIAAEDAPFRQTFAARYDELGNLVSETHIDWIDDKQLPLTSTFQYDSWGALAQTTRPDGVAECEVYDPIGAAGSEGPTKRVFLRSSDDRTSNVTVTEYNRFGKTSKVTRFDADDTGVGADQYFYDGLGRLVDEIDARDLTTSHRYDAFDRAVETVLPDGTVIARIYAAHSSEDLPISIAGNGIVLGEQTFDGLDRLTSTTTGGRLRSYEFDPGMTDPKWVTTPAGHRIAYEYNVLLGEEPIVRSLPESVTNYGYDKQNAQLIHCVEQGYEISREYTLVGNLKTEIRREGGAEYVAQYGYSLRGRLCRFTDVFGADYTQTYDAAGRLKTFLGGTTTATFTYDQFGRLASVLTQDSALGRHVETVVEYDALGRESSRSFDLGGLKRKIILNYYPDDRLESQAIMEDDTVIRIETYRYDLRGRLENYQCTGSSPLDPFGNAITAQQFRYDAIDNIVEVTTNFPDAANTAVFEYDETDPVQLKQITNDHPDYPRLAVLDYDADGNLVRDDNGNALEYDPLGRLTMVRGKMTTTYRYDGLDVLAGGSSDGVSEQRFYREGELSDQARGAQRSSFLRAAGYPLGERRQDNSGRLFATDRKGSVVAELGETNEVGEFAYTAYGHRSGDASTRIGYNGELHEDGTAWQLLGNGYRAYNPNLIRLHSPDSLSPFAEGGINTYAYCIGDPVNLLDPSGNFPIAAILGLTAVGAGVAAGFTEGPTQIALTVIAAVAGIAAGGAGYRAYAARAKRLSASPVRSVPDPKFGVTYLHHANGKITGIPLTERQNRGGLLQTPASSFPPPPRSSSLEDFGGFVVKGEGAGLRFSPARMRKNIFKDDASGSPSYAEISERAPEGNFNRNPEGQDPDEVRKWVQSVSPPPLPPRNPGMRQPGESTRRSSAIRGNQ